MLPGVTDSAVTLPLTGAVTVSRLESDLLPGAAPSDFKRA